MADNVDTSSDFFARISNDANIPKEDVQKYILATSDFAKSIQTDINHYVTRDRINNASFRQKLDSISKNILRKQNPLELVFEDLSTFDAENPIVGSLLREIDIKKKQSDSDFIKSLPSHPGKEFEIKKRLDKFRDRDDKYFNNNNNSNPGGGSPGTNIDLINMVLMYHHLYFQLLKILLIMVHLFLLFQEEQIFHLIIQPLPLQNKILM